MTDTAEDNNGNGAPVRPDAGTQDRSATGAAGPDGTTSVAGSGTTSVAGSGTTSVAGSGTTRAAADGTEAADTGPGTGSDGETGEADPATDAVSRAGRTTNLVCGAVVSLVGLGAFIVALDLGLGSLSRPAAGTWPGVVSMILIVLGLLIAARAATYTDAEPITKNAVGVAVVVIGLAVAVQLFPLVGFEIPSFVLLVSWMSVLGKEKLRLSVPISLVTVAAFYLTFVYGLAVPIPRLF